MTLSQYHVKYCPYHAFIFQMSSDGASCFFRLMWPQCSHQHRFNILVAGSHVLQAAARTAAHALQAAGVYTNADS